MLYQTNQLRNELDSAEATTSLVMEPLPAGIVFTARAIASLRAYLNRNGLGNYRILHCPNHELWEVDQLLETPAEEGGWEEFGPVEAVEPLWLLTHDDRSARFWPAGFLRLPRFRAVVARWYWLESTGNMSQVWLCAVAAPEDYCRLRHELEERRHARGAAVWQIIRTAPHQVERIAREMPREDDLMLPEPVRRRVQMDVVEFLGRDIAELYRALDVPHRRGVLLHGPPGNGKTSTIRYIGATMSRVPAIVLRPAANFNTAMLDAVLQHWRRQAPAILIIEDLDWLLQLVNVSAFLNQLDGIESKLSGGLLLIATTNHPEKLDPAINNRPGRFDVTIELPNPDASLRLRFFQRKLSDADDKRSERLADATEGLSFAHLQEILRLSGLLAIREGRRTRGDEDLTAAVEMVRQGCEAAARGFAPKPEMPFGLAALHQRSRRG